MILIIKLNSDAHINIKNHMAEVILILIHYRINIDFHICVHEKQG